MKFQGEIPYQKQNKVDKVGTVKYLFIARFCFNSTAKSRELQVRLLELEMGIAIAVCL